jgi:hypothetical protein
MILMLADQLYFQSLSEVTFTMSVLVLKKADHVFYAKIIWLIIGKQLRFFVDYLNADL